MAAKFEIRSAGGQYSWVLLSQGRTLASGGPYARRAMAEKAIGSLRAAVGGAAVADLTIVPPAASAKAAPAKRTSTKTTKATTAAKTTAAAKKAAPRRRAAKK